MTPNQYMERSKALGCLVCRREGLGPTPADYHHVLLAGRRTDHFRGYPLCFNHHRSYRNDKEVVSYHPWRTAFRTRYGADRDLIEQNKREIMELYDE